MNIPERGAFFLNGGNIFDPVLVGYREMQRVWRETLEGEDDEASSAVSSSAPSPGSDPLASSEEASNASLPEADADLSAHPVPSVPIQATTATATSAVTGSKGLPPGYVDLRIGGIGLVLDFGWRRTDEGLRWEVENVRQAAEAKRTRRVTRERRRKGEPAQPQAQAIPVAAPVPAAGDKGDSAWLRTPFVGLW